MDMQRSTERLLLRPLRQTDLPYLQHYAVRPDVYRYMPVPAQTEEMIAAFLETRLQDQQNEAANRFTFAVEPIECGFLVGTVRIAIDDTENRQGDIGFAIDPDYQGQGYMTEAVLSALRFGFRDLALHRIWAMTDVENQRSQKLLERVGMMREGHFRKNMNTRGEWRDSFLYAILETDFDV